MIFKEFVRECRERISRDENIVIVNIGRERSGKMYGMSNHALLFRVIEWEDYTRREKKLFEVVNVESQV